MTKHSLPISLLFSCCLSPSLFAQASPTVAPAITSPGTVPGAQMFHTSGEFNYSLTASESYISGYQGSGSGASTNLSGQATYVSNSETHPTSLLYSGGYFFGNGSDINSSSYQSLGVSQILRARRWRLGVSDVITYLPSSPLYSVSGVPFSGDVGTSPISTGQVPTQSILTNYGEQVSNTVSGSVSRDLTGKAFIEGYTAYTVQRFLQTGLNNNDLLASGSLGHRFSVRDSVAASYTYGQYSFAQSVAGIQDFQFVSHGVSANYSHAFSRKLAIELSAGPQWISSNTPSVLPDRVLFTSAVSLSYTGERTRASAGYSRSPNIGSGVLLGALSDNVNFSMQHVFSRDWSGGLTANYGRASGLAALPGENIITDSFYGGVQANRRISENFTAFASYSVATQSAGSQAVSRNAFDGTAHIVTVGITFSPHTRHVGRP